MVAIMPDPDETISIIHALASSEVAYSYHLNAPVRGIVGATKAMERNRLNAFETFVGRKPTDEEKERLLYGDG